MTEVCITGYGVVSPLGNAIERFDAALFGGRSAVRGRNSCCKWRDRVGSDLIRGCRRPDGHSVR